MIRNAAIVVVILGLFVVFNAHIKAGLLETRNAIALSRIELDTEHEQQLRQLIERIADGYVADVYTEVESLTLLDGLADMRSYAGKEMSVAKAEALASRFELILERHEL